MVKRGEIIARNRAISYRKYGFDKQRCIEETTLLNNAILFDSIPKEMLEKIVNEIYEMPEDQFSKLQTSEVPERREPVSEEKLPVVCATELKNMEIQDQAWLIDGYIPDKSINVLAGKRASYKTWSGIYIAECVASGHPFLGTFNTKKCTVLYIDEENGYPSLNEKREKIEAGLGIETPDNLYFLSFYGLKIETQKELLENFISQNNPCLIIVDSFRRIITVEEDEMRTQVILDGVMFVKTWLNEHPNPSPDAWLFPSPKDPTKPVDRATIAYAIKSAAKRCQITGVTLYPHAFRHRQLTESARYLPMPLLKRKAGHARTSQIAEEVYIHLGDPDLKKAELESRGLIPVHELGKNKELKLTRKCPYCQGQNFDKAVFCISCRHPIDQASIEKRKELEWHTNLGKGIVLLAQKYPELQQVLDTLKRKEGT